MSDKAAGWYPDPDGENRQRYWDGSGWTEYYTPLAAPKAEVHGSATAVEDYPYLASTRAGAHHQVMIAPGTAGSGWPAAGGGGTAAASGETQEFSGAGRRSSASRWALIAATVIVVMLVVGVGWWAIGGRGGDDPTGNGPTSSGPAPTDGPTTTGTVGLGSPVTGELEAGGLFVGELAIGSATTLAIDARSDDDLVLELVDVATGDVVERSDDRPAQLAAIGDNGLDPLLLTTLEPGDYEIQLRERDGGDTEFEVIASEIPAIALEVPVTASAPARGGWFGFLDVPADAGYTIDVAALDGGDPVLVLLGPDDDLEFNDDRTDDDRDPLIEDTLTAGTWFVVFYEYDRDALDATVTVTQG